MLELKNIVKEYKTADETVVALKGVSTEFRSSEFVSILGPSGCGKTTLINLIMRFYDVTSGEIDMDGIPSKLLERKSLRRNIGMVLQDTWIRKASVKDNVAIGKPDATQAEIEEACRRAHCHGFISRLPKGYDTIIGEEGLSQGQKQLISIARVMLCLPPVLILDEATSALDNVTEMQIQEALERLSVGRTTIVVAHRLSTVKNADEIVVLASDGIEERGTHDELMRKNGVYATLYNYQFRNL